MRKYLLDANTLISLFRDKKIWAKITNQNDSIELKIINNVKDEFLRGKKGAREKFLEELNIITISPSTTIFGLSKFPIRFGGKLAYGDPVQAFQNVEKGEPKALNPIIDALQVNTALDDNLILVTNDKEPKSYLKTTDAKKPQTISFKTFKKELFGV